MTPSFPQAVEPKSTVVSMLHHDLREEKPGLVPSLFIIKAGSMEKPSVTHIKAAKHFVYLDGDRGSLPVRDASYEVARSIVEDYSSAQMGVSDGVYPGLCWFPGDLNMEQIRMNKEYSAMLETVKIAHMRWLNHLITMADNDFAKYKQHNVVSGFQRVIASIMRIDPKKHPWMNDDNILESDSCPGCGLPVRPGLIVHGGPGGCGFILDKKRYNPADFAGATLVPTVNLQSVDLVK